MDWELDKGLRDRLDEGDLEGLVIFEAAVGDSEGVGELEELFEGNWSWVVEVGLFILRAREAGGPTGTIREPNSTPIVTS